MDFKKEMEDIIMKKVISTDKAPAAIGPYSQAIEVNGMIFTSGVIPIDPATNTLVEGDITGSIMFLLKEDAAHDLVNKLMGVSGPDSGEFSEMELSALKQIGNIITGAYLNSLSMLTNMKIIPSVPDLSIDMAGAILSVPAIEFGALGDRILLIQTQFTDDKLLDGFFILVPDLESYDKIMASLGCN